jgi:hypothetical protein
MMTSSSLHPRLRRSSRETGKKLLTMALNHSS